MTRPADLKGLNLEARLNDLRDYQVSFDAAGGTARAAALQRARTNSRTWTWGRAQLRSGLSEQAGRGASALSSTIHPRVRALCMYVLCTWRACRRACEHGTTRADVCLLRPSWSAS